MTYSGLDLSREYIDAAKRRYPDGNVDRCDVLTDNFTLSNFDYVVMNGIFTRRHDLAMDEMTRYVRQLCVRMFGICRVGMAFNFMSQYVDYHDEALYYPNLADVADFVGGHLSKHFALRNDYGLYECTCYVYRDPLVTAEMQAMPV